MPRHARSRQRWLSSVSLGGGTITIDFMNRSQHTVFTRCSRVRLTAALAIFSSLSTIGCITTTPPASRFVEIEHRWVDALQTHDTATLDQLLDDTFIDSTFRGALRTKRDVLTGPPAAGSYRSIRFGDVAVRTYGNHIAVVTGVNVLRGKGVDDIVRVRFTDVFVNRRGQWRAVSAQETVQADLKLWRR